MKKKKIDLQDIVKKYNMKWPKIHIDIDEIRKKMNIKWLKKNINKKWIIEHRKKIIINTIYVIAGFLIIKFLLCNVHPFGEKIKVSGNIEGTEVRLAFRIKGKITEILTDEGMYINVGDIVSRLDTDEWSKIVAETRASLKAEKYRHKLAYDDYVRAENLLLAGSISTQQRDAYKTKAEATKANVEELQAKLELALTRLGYTNLAAPLNGYILVKSAEAGEVVQEGATVFTAMDLNDIWLTAYVNEKDFGKVKLNQKGYVVTDAYPHKKYYGWVSFISPEAEFTPKYIQTNSERVKLVYRIKIRVDNSSRDLKPGLPGDGYIILR